MSLQPPTKVGKLQAALHSKAKRATSYRFYALYDKILRRDVLWFAYRRCLINGGAPGVDGETFDDIEAYGEMRWLDELTDDLRKKSYRPQAVRRVWIPKPGSSEKRPLGIPTIRDRVVQMAVLLILEPIFEADLQSEQYAYRPGRSAKDAVEHVLDLLDAGYTEVIDADLSGYFDSIPHADLMKSVARRVSDRHLLHLIRMWLETPVEEIDNRGRRRRTTRNKDSRCGTPQGAPISPMLSNLYMRRFVLGWKVLGHEKRLSAKIVNYADDFVICCRGTSTAASAMLAIMMDELKLTLNSSKTHVCRLPDESFDFLGFTFARLHSPRTGNAYLGAYPARKRVRRLCQRISAMTGRNSVLKDVPERVAELNRVLIGWGNYFRIGSVSRAYRAVDAHTRRRFRQWLCRKHKRQGSGASRYSDEYLYEQLGLTRLSGRTRNFSWAKE
jgi:RNA-directed DNA polymerase